MAYAITMDVWRTVEARQLVDRSRSVTDEYVRTGYMHDCPARSVSFDYSQDNANQ